jgi:transcriptional regulator with XRE-family HTH domain
MMRAKTVLPDAPSATDEEILNNEHLNAHVGRQIHKLRKQRGLTQGKLSELSGVSDSQLSQIENGQVTANVATLWSIARALDVDIARLFPRQSPSEDFEIIRAEKRGKVTPDHADPGFSGYDHEHIASLHTQGTIEIFAVDVSVSKPEEAKFNTHIGREFVFVLEGKVEFLAKGNYKEKLREGDALHFPSEYPHAYRAIELPSKMLAVLYTPSDSEQELSN